MDARDVIIEWWGVVLIVGLVSVWYLLKGGI